MADLSGQTFGRYQLIERMGRGGMADVYKAFQPGLDRFVAVKVLHPHLSEDPDFIERFKREAKAVAALQHPYIINVIDFDTYDGPMGLHQFMVMTYIEGGRTLKEVLVDQYAPYASESQRDRLPMDQALDITAKLADALNYAHEQGMVHRDIKPANVLLPTLSQPLLSDFGIARILGQTGLTASGAMIGTPAYMSPEQGKGEAADERSDIYALGIVLYEMLIGRPPYDADTPYGVILKHINDPLTVPDNVSLPDAVLRVLYTSLAKDPDQRYASAGALHDALKKALAAVLDDTPASFDTGPLVAPADTTMPIPAGMENQATVPVEVSAQPRSAPKAKRGFPAWAYGVIGLVVVGLLVGGLALSGVLSGGNGEGPEPESEAGNEEQEESGGPAELAEETSPDDNRFVPTIDNIDYGQYIDEARASGDPNVLAQAGDDVFVFLQDSQLAGELYDEALALDPQHAEALGGRALAYAMMNEFEAAQAHIEAAFEQDDWNITAHLAKATLEQAWEPMFNPDGALESLTIVIEQCDQNAGFCAGAYADRAQLNAWQFGNWDQALADSQMAQELNPNPYAQAGYFASTARLLFAIGDLPSAADHFEAAYAASDHDMDYLREAIAIRAYTGDLGTAELFNAQLQEIYPADPRLLADEGYLKLLRGDIDGALANAERSLTIDPNAYPAFYLRGLTLMEAGDTSGARDAFQALTDIETWQYDFPFYRTEYGHSLYLEMARASRMAGDNDGALAFIDRALEQESWWVDPYLMRAEILIDRGDLVQARDALVYALEIAQDLGQEDRIGEIQQRLDELGT